MKLHMKQMRLITFLRKIFFETLRVTGIEIQLDWELRVNREISFWFLWRQDVSTNNFLLFSEE